MTETETATGTEIGIEIEIENEAQTKQNPVSIAECVEILLAAFAKVVGVMARCGSISETI